MYEYNEQTLSGPTYMDVYWYRNNKYGTNHKEREYNYGIRNFEKYLNEHPSSIDVIIDGTSVKASIISNKQDQYKTTKQILTTINTIINPGSMIKWNDKYWIVFQKEENPNQTYNSCYIVKCNKEIKWIDNYGVERKQYAYILSSKDSIIKQNFRTWNRLITPQSNQWLEMLVKTDESIKLGQKFIIDGRAWFVDEYDMTSAEGVTFYSLTEDKIDRLDDDIENEVANINNLNSYQIIMQEEINCAIDNNYIINPIVYGNGTIQEESLGYIIDNEEIASLITKDKYSMIVPKNFGSTELKIYLINQPKVFKSITVNITNSTEQATVLVGDDSIRTTDSSNYYVYNISHNKEIEPIISFSISNKLLATGEKNDDGSVKIIANEDNRLGIVKVIFNTENNSYVKDITIKSLW